MLSRFFRAALFLATAIGAVAAPRLNVVFILADDFGWRDLGCYGSTFYETPHVDQLARDGLRFTQAYAACNVCSPTRASIMTGKYPARLHLTDWLPGRPDNPHQLLSRPPLPSHLALGEFTVAEAFAQAGYTTCFIGKWHLGGRGYYPSDQGFRYNIGGCHLGHPPSYFSPYHIPTLQDGPKGEYLTDRLTNEAIAFIRSHKDGPFFLYLAHYAVHNPQQAKPELIAKYRAKLKAKPPPPGPEFRPEGDHETRQVQDQPVYAAMVESLDQSIGRILAELDREGLAGNTIVVFTSDNGGLATAEGSPTSNEPLRAGKGWPYEGGVREPLIVRWPGVTRPDSTSDQPVISTDFYPTLLAMTGLPPEPQQCLDGVSFVPVLEGRTMPERPLFWHYPHYSNQGGRPEGAVRLGDYKLIEWYEDMHVELFNLRDDPGEHHDLALALPQKTDELRRLLHQWRKSVGAAMPSRNPAYEPGDPWHPRGGAKGRRQAKAGQG